MNYTSTARKDGRWWVVQCDQEPGALSQVARLDQAAEHQREAISFVTDIDEADIEVTINPVIGDTVSIALDRARQEREQSEQLAASAAAEFQSAAQALASEGYSLRDIGVILGVSFQRAGQLTKA